MCLGNGDVEAECALEPAAQRVEIDLVADMRHGTDSIFNMPRCKNAATPRTKLGD